MNVFYKTSIARIFLVALPMSVFSMVKTLYMSHIEIKHSKHDLIGFQGEEDYTFLCINILLPLMQLLIALGFCTSNKQHLLSSGSTPTTNELKVWKSQNYFGSSIFYLYTSKLHKVLSPMLAFKVRAKYWTTNLSLLIEDTSDRKYSKRILANCHVLSTDLQKRCYKIWNQSYATTVFLFCFVLSFSCLYRP